METKFSFAFINWFMKQEREKIKKMKKKLI